MKPKNELKDYKKKKLIKFLSLQYEEEARQNREISRLANEISNNSMTIKRLQDENIDLKYTDSSMKRSIEHLNKECIGLRLRLEGEVKLKQKIVDLQSLLHQQGIEVMNAKKRIDELTQPKKESKKRAVPLMD